MDRTMPLSLVGGTTKECKNLDRRGGKGMLKQLENPQTKKDFNPLWVASAYRRRAKG